MKIVNAAIKKALDFKRQDLLLKVQRPKNDEVIFTQTYHPILQVFHYDKLFTLLQCVKFLNIIKSKTVFKPSTKFLMVTLGPWPQGHDALFRSTIGPVFRAVRFKENSEIF